MAGRDPESLEEAFSHAPTRTATVLHTPGHSARRFLNAPITRSLTLASREVLRCPGAVSRARPLGGDTWQEEAPYAQCADLAWLESS